MTEDGRTQRAMKRSLADMDRQAWGKQVAEYRRLDRPAPAPAPGFLADLLDHIDPGHPLGHGMPTGRTLRRDGETHRQAWSRVIRQDPCSYCGEVVAMALSSVDHIEPQSRSVRGIGGAHSWLNFTGACQRCNEAKSNIGLLEYLLVRAGRQIPKQGPGRQVRRVQAREKRARQRQRRRERLKHIQVVNPEGLTVTVDVDGREVA